MKKITVGLLVVGAGACLMGCTGMAGVARAVAKDPAFVTVQVRTIYGSGMLVRDGRPLSGNVVSSQGDVSSTPGTNYVFLPGKTAVTLPK